MISRDRNVKSVIILISFLYIFEYTSYGQVISGTKYVVMLLGVFLLVLEKKGDFFCLPKKYSALFIAISFVLIPLIQSVSNGSIAIAMYLVVMLVFLIFVYSVGEAYLNTDKKLQWFVTTFAIIGTVVIAVCFLLNFSNLFNVSAIMSNFSTELSNSNITVELTKRERSEFGFMHVNSLGGICLAVMVGLNMSKPDRKILRVMRTLAMLFIFLIVLNTGSRASIYGIVAYFLTLGAEKLYYKSSAIFKLILKFLLIAVAIYVLTIIVSTITNNFDFANQLTSYRLEGWIYDINKMQKDGTLLFGYGMYNPTAFFSQSFANGMIVDNWYVYMIVNIGFVGFISCVLLIITLFRSLLQKCAYGDNSMALKVLALFVANLFHAMAEKAFITPADPISFFMLVVVFAMVCRRENESEDYLLEGETEI